MTLRALYLRDLKKLSPALNFIRASGQHRKLIAGCIVLIAGACMLGAAFVRADSRLAGQSATLFIAGLVMMLFAFVLSVGFVACPRCGAKLLWRALSDRDASQWLPWLLSLERCPVCDYRPESASDEGVGKGRELGRTQPHFSQFPQPSAGCGNSPEIFR